MVGTAANPRDAEAPNTARRTLRDVVDAAESLLKSGVNETSREYRRAREALASTLEAAKDGLAEQADELAWTARIAARRSDRLVRRHAWAAIGIGAGVGLVLGLMLRRPRGR